MKVIFLLPSLKVSGGSYIFEIANQLVNKGHEVQITSLDEIVPVTYFPLLVSPIKIGDAQNLFPDADAIISYYPVCAFYLNDIKTRAKKFHLITEDQKSFYSKEVFKVNYPSLDKDRLDIEYRTQQTYIEKSYTLPLHYLVTNFELADLFTDHYHRKVTVVPVGVNNAQYFPEIVFPKVDAPRILVEGNLMPWKGVGEINKALSMTRGYQLWTVSDTKQTIRSDKHWQNLDINHLRGVLSSCNILIRGYSEDGLGEVEAQAMACGCAVLTKENSGNKMFCKNKINCITFKNEVDLEKKLKELLVDKEMRNNLISQGLETAKSLDWKNTVKVLEKVIGGKHV